MTKERLEMMLYDSKRYDLDAYDHSAIRDAINALDLIKDIQGALSTEESGEALVEVARNAHRAELKLSGMILKKERNRR